MVGAGPFGSSACKYLTAVLGLNAVLIGPGESETDHYHGAWFDEGRITRVFDSSPYWQDLGRL